MARQIKQAQTTRYFNNNKINYFDGKVFKDTLFVDKLGTDNDENTIFSVRFNPILRLVGQSILRRMFPHQFPPV